MHGGNRSVFETTLTDCRNWNGSGASSLAEGQGVPRSADGVVMVVVVVVVWFLLL